MAGPSASADSGAGAGTAAPDRWAPPGPQRAGFAGARGVPGEPAGSGATLPPASEPAAASGPEAEPEGPPDATAEPASPGPGAAPRGPAAAPDGSVERASEAWRARY